MKISPEELKKGPWLINAICPYFTMFPLEYPVKILDQVDKECVVFDPFCGRGTSLFAARMYGHCAYGIDNNPVAVAISESKMVAVSVKKITDTLEKALNFNGNFSVPQSEFWNYAFEKSVLKDICKIRSYLLSHNRASEKALRGIMLGALHGPKTKNIQNASYFSNQMPRTFSSKPNYSVNFWKKNNIFPEKVDIREIVKKRALKFSAGKIPLVKKRIVHGDSMTHSLYKKIPSLVDIIITSPPYYGMRTYYIDQWLRNWFLGGPEFPKEMSKTELNIGTAIDFSASLGKVWANCANISTNKTKMYVRFGSIPSRDVDPIDIFNHSIELCGNKWKLINATDAGSYSIGKRQANQMIKKNKSNPLNEYDLELIKNA